MGTKTISVAMCVNKLDINGMSTVIINYCRYINKEKYKLTIIAGTPIDKLYQEEFIQLGINFVEIPSKKNETLGYYRSLYCCLKKSKIDIFHMHGNSSLMALELIIAKWAGIKIRVAHCHNTSCSNISLHRFLLPVFNSLYTKGLACSCSAGKWLYGSRDYTVIWNGFDYRKFVYDITARKSIRGKFGIENGMVIGHVGRMNEQKNQEYLLKVFTEISKMRNDVWLLLVGTGPNYDYIKRLVELHEKKDRIILYGETSAPEQLYSAFDIFVFPSKFEGFGMVMTEAQVSGLSCVASTEVPEDVVISERVYFLPISKNKIFRWAEVIYEILENVGKIHRDMLDMEKLSKFDIKKNVKMLERCYEESFRNT